MIARIDWAFGAVLTKFWDASISNPMSLAICREKLEVTFLKLSPSKHLSKLERFNRVGDHRCIHCNCLRIVPVPFGAVIIQIHFGDI